MITYRIAKASAPFLDDLMEVELQHDLDNLRFLSMLQARDYANCLLADHPLADFHIEKERYPGIYDGKKNRVYLRQGTQVAAFYPSRLGFFDTREVTLMAVVDFEPETQHQWDRFAHLAA